MLQAEQRTQREEPKQQKEPLQSVLQRRQRKEDDGESPGLPAVWLHSSEVCWSGGWQARPLGPRMCEGEDRKCWQLLSTQAGQGQDWSRGVSEVGLVPGGVVHVLQNPPDDPLQLLPGPLLLLQRPPHPLVVLRRSREGSFRSVISPETITRPEQRPHLLELLHLVLQAVHRVHQAPAGPATVCGDVMMFR